MLSQEVCKCYGAWNLCNLCAEQVRDYVLPFLCTCEILELKGMQQKVFGKTPRRLYAFPLMLSSCYLIHFQIVQFCPLKFSPTSFQEMFEPTGQF